MELKMEVYTPDLAFLGILEVYQSVLWEESAFQAGSFSVESLIAPQSMSLLLPENILWIGADTAGIIESVQASALEDGSHITVKGPLLSGIFERRILWGQYNLYGTVPDLMYQMVDDCAINPSRGDAEQRKIPALVLESNLQTKGHAIRKQKTGGSLLEFLEEVGESNQTAFGIRFNPQIPRMEFWARYGVDRSDKQTKVEPVFYSTELDDVLSSEYSYNSCEYKNAALVAGEGEGLERTYITVEGSDVKVRTSDEGGPFGFFRRELFVDAKDIQSKKEGTDDTMTQEEYTAALQTRGTEKLAESRLVQSFQAVVRVYDPTYEYGVDFFLGDTITVTDERLGITVDAVVQGVERFVSKNGEGLSLMLGYRQPTLYERLRRKGEK